MLLSIIVGELFAEFCVLLHKTDNVTDLNNGEVAEKDFALFVCTLRPVMLHLLCFFMMFFNQLLSCNDPLSVFLAGTARLGN